MLELIAAAFILGAIPFLAAFGVRFRRRQNAGALGGAISKAKAYWLPFAIWFWFVVCPVVAFDGVVAFPLRCALGAFGVSMWMRGAAEMVMLYVTKNWRPPIGIAHDVACIALVGAVLAFFGLDLMTLRPGLDLWAVGLVVAVVVSLLVEIHHAWSFFEAVKLSPGGRTTGEDGVWFADDEQERFRRINQNTFRWNIILSLAVTAFVVRYLWERVP